VRKDLQELVLNPIWGWFGQQNAFDFSLDYQPAPGINRFLVGTPPVLSLAAVESGVDLILEAGIDNLREKSVLQTEFLIELWEEFLKPLGVELNSPRDGSHRGSHISLGHPEAYRIDQALIEEMNVIPDFRTPDNIRFGVTPLYTTFEELFQAVVRTRQVIVEERYKPYPSERANVT
jgi:kynureninase